MATVELGSVAFSEHEVQRVSTSKSSEQLIFSMPFEDADSTEVYNWGGCVRRFEIDGNTYESTFAAAKTRYDQILGLIVGEQTPILFKFPLETAGIYVMVESAECWSDANACPVGHFAFRINLVQAKV